MSDLHPTKTATPDTLSKHEFFAKYYAQSVAILISVAAGIFLTDYTRKEAESALADLKAKNAGTGALQISGNVYQEIDGAIPTLGLRRCTLSLSLSTSGEKPVKISSVAVRLRKNKLPEQWSNRLFNYEETLHGYSLSDRPGRGISGVRPVVFSTPAPPLAPVVTESASNGSPAVENPPEGLQSEHLPAEFVAKVRESNIFLIAPTVPIWNEAATFGELHYGKDGTIGTIFPNQDRPFAVDFLVADGSVPELVFIEVEIRLDTETEDDEQVRKWSTWIGTGPGLRCRIFQGPNGSLSSTCFPVY